MVRFQIGDRVRFLYETGEGLVRQINGNKLTVEDENGFLQEYEPSSLVPAKNISVENIKSKDQNDHKSSGIKLVKTKKDKEIPLIDLHIENLLDSHKHLQNHDIVLTQLKHFKQFLSKTENQKAPKIIVVHGVGSGRLKQEIIEIVRGMPGASIYDADYKLFGQGASVIERKFNWR